MNRLRPVLLPALFTVTLGVLVCAGCDDSLNVCDPVLLAGRIEGRVQTGGVPFEGEVLAIGYDPDTNTRNRFRVEPDSTGFYAFDLPAGRFTIELNFFGQSGGYSYTSEGPGYGEIPPDTLLVDGAHSHTGIDFALGGMTLDLQLSSLLDGETGGIVLHRRDEDPDEMYPGYVRGDDGPVMGGHLVIDVAGILPGEYKVEIILGSWSNYYYEDGAEVLWMPGTRDRDASPWYDVGPGEAIHLDAALEGGPAVLQGSVTGAWLEMGLSQGPSVGLFTPDSVLVMGGRRVEEDGSFSLPVHTPGPVKVLVSQRGVEQWIGGPGFAEATVFDLDPGQTVSGITMEQSGVNIQVGSDLNLGWSTEIRFYDAPGVNLVATMRDYGGSAYQIGVPNLWPGEYLVFLTPTWDALGTFPWRPQWWDRAVDPAQAQRVVLGPGGDIRRLDLVLERGGTISGSFTGNPNPTWSFYVYAVPVADPAVEKTFRRHPFDGYQIKGLPEGGYKVGVLPWNLAFEGPETPGFIWYPGTSSWDAAEALLIENANTITGIDFEIP